MSYHHHEHPAFRSVLTFAEEYSFFDPPSLNLSLWDSLDTILYNLARKYRPRYEGDKMLVELMDVNLDPSDAVDFLWRFRERGT